MKVLRYRAHHVQKISDIDWNLEGHNLFLVGGRNGQGKTSGLVGLLMALCGRSGGVWPEVALQEGQKEGWVKVDLGDDPRLTIELYLRRARSGQVTEKFRVLDADGKEVRQPRELLKRLYSLHAFDPRGFERLDPKQQREILLKLAGFDYGAMEAEYKEFYGKRTEVNRDGKRLRARHDAMPGHVGVPAEEVSVSALISDRDRLQQANGAIQKERERVEGMGGRISAAATQLAARQDEIAILVKEAKHLETKLAADKEAYETLSKAVAGLNEEPLDEINRQIGSVEDTNRKIRQNQEKERLGRELAGMRTMSEQLTEKMNTLRATQQRKLADVEWPVDGLSFDDDGILYGGLPFRQAANSDRLDISVQIGMALNPKLRLLVSQDMNDLDDESEQRLQKRLEERDFLMIAEVVTRSDADEERCAVVIEDGRQKESRDEPQ